MASTLTDSPVNFAARLSVGLVGLVGLVGRLNSVIWSRVTARRSKCTRSGLAGAFADVDQVVDWLLTEGRKRGGRPGTGLSPRSVQRTLAVFQKACEDAIDDRLIGMNPCRRVKRLKQVGPVHELWSDDETALFGKAATADRLSPVITLQCLGLRPEEVCGLRWRDVNLAAGTITIRMARTLVDGRPIEKPPKTDAGKRTVSRRVLDSVEEAN
jgi:integrase